MTLGLAIEECFPRIALCYGAAPYRMKWMSPSRAGDVEEEHSRHSRISMANGATGMLARRSLSALGFPDAA